MSDAPTPGPRAEAEAPWSVVRRFATGVAVVLTGSGTLTRGATVSTFSLAARTPPLVSVSLRRRSACLALLKEEGAFAVSVLASDQAALARHFADPARPCGLGQLGPDAWYHGPAGPTPLLRGAVGWLDCLLELVVPLGDHELVVGRVRSAASGDGSPLVQYAGVLHDAPQSRPESRDLEGVP